MKLKHAWIQLALCVGSFSAAAADDPLQTVRHVMVSHYMGRWYEIASFPQKFSKDCVNSQATYTLRFDHKVEVLNECWKGSPDGPHTEAAGIARIVDPETNAKLKVMFMSPYEGDYWIIDLDEEYQLAAVSEPKRKALWILSRTTTVEPTKLDALLQRLQNVHSFDLTKLEYTRR